MDRDMDKFKESLERHHTWQLDYFNVIKSKLISKAKEHKALAEIKKNKNLIEEAEDAMKKHDDLIKEADDMRFQFDRKEAMINYGNCKKFDGKQPSFPI